MHFTFCHFYCSSFISLIVTCLSVTIHLYSSFFEPLKTVVFFFFYFYIENKKQKGRWGGWIAFSLDKELVFLLYFMAWNIKYLVYNNVKWPGPELWCHWGFFVCFLVYGFEISIFCCRLIRLSGLVEWIMVWAWDVFLNRRTIRCSHTHVLSEVISAMVSTYSLCKEYIKKKNYTQFMKHKHLTVSIEQDYINSKIIYFAFSVLQLTF